MKYIQSEVCSHCSVVRMDELFDNWMEVGLKNLVFNETRKVLFNLTAGAVVIIVIK